MSKSNQPYIECSEPKCGEPSYSVALKNGQDKCEYHWNVDIWGEPWADYIKAKREQERRDAEKRNASR
jgi:hypothetical protein